MSVWKQLGKPRKLPVMLIDFRVNSMSAEYETHVLGCRVSSQRCRIENSVRSSKIQMRHSDAVVICYCCHHYMTISLCVNARVIMSEHKNSTVSNNAKCQPHADLGMQLWDVC